MTNRPTTGAGEQVTSTEPDLRAYLTSGDMTRILVMDIRTLRKYVAQGLIQEAGRIGPRGDRRYHPDEPARFLASMRDNPQVRAENPAA